MSRIDSLGQYEQTAVRTVERHGFAVVEKAPEAPGCWVVWHVDQSYQQGHVMVFGTEVEALRHAVSVQQGYNVTFVPWGSSPWDAENEKRDV